MHQVHQKVEAGEARGQSSVIELSVIGTLPSDAPVLWLWGAGHLVQHTLTVRAHALTGGSSGLETADLPLPGCPSDTGYLQSPRESWAPAGALLIPCHVPSYITVAHGGAPHVENTGDGGRKEKMNIRKQPPY